MTDKPESKGKPSYAAVVAIGAPAAALSASTRSETSPRSSAQRPPAAAAHSGPRNIAQKNNTNTSRRGASKQSTTGQRQARGGRGRARQRKFAPASSSSSRPAAPASRLTSSDAQVNNAPASPVPEAQLDPHDGSSAKRDVEETLRTAYKQEWTEYNFSDMPLMIDALMHCLTNGYAFEPGSLDDWQPDLTNLEDKSADCVGHACILHEKLLKQGFNCHVVAGWKSSAPNDMFDLTAIPMTVPAMDYDYKLVPRNSQQPHGALFVESLGDQPGYFLDSGVRDIVQVNASSATKCRKHAKGLTCHHAVMMFGSVLLHMEQSVPDDTKQATVKVFYLYDLKDVVTEVGVTPTDRGAVFDPPYRALWTVSVPLMIAGVEKCYLPRGLSEGKCSFRGQWRGNIEQQTSNTGQLSDKSMQGRVEKVFKTICQCYKLLLQP